MEMRGGLLNESKVNPGGIIGELPHSSCDTTAECWMARKSSSSAISSVAVDDLVRLVPLSRSLLTWWSAVGRSKSPKASFLCDCWVSIKLSMTSRL